MDVLPLYGMQVPLANDYFHGAVEVLGDQQVLPFGGDLHDAVGPGQSYYYGGNAREMRGS